MADPTWSITASFTVPISTGASMAADAPALLPGPILGTLDFGQGTVPAALSYKAIPTGTTDFTWTSSIDSLPPDGEGQDAVISFFDSSLAFISQQFPGFYVHGSSTSSFGSITIPGTAAYWIAWFVNLGDSTSAHTFTQHYQFFTDSMIGTFLFGLGVGLSASFQRKLGRARVLVIG